MASILIICNFCSVLHLHVQTKMELQRALSICQQLERDCVIEVESSIKSNSSFHRFDIFTGLLFL